MNANKTQPGPTIRKHLHQMFINTEAISFRGPDRVTNIIYICGMACNKMCRNCLTVADEFVSGGFKLQSVADPITIFTTCPRKSLSILQYIT